MRSDDTRVPNRRQVLKAIGTTVLATGLAGCSGDSDDAGGSDDTDGSDDTNADATDADADRDDGTDGDGTDTQTGDSSSDGEGESEYVREPMGSVGRNDIAELEVVSWESEITNGSFHVFVAVRNDGDQQADAREYTFQIVPYDEDGTEIETRGTSTSYPGETRMSSGGVGSVRVTPAIDADPEAVASYEVLLHCDGPFAEGVYCAN